MEHTIIVQFRNSGGFGTGDELDWRYSMEEQIGDLLESRGLGYCDGGQGGAGAMELFFNVPNIAPAVDEIIRFLTDQEYIGFSKIVSRREDDTGPYTVHYPPNATFSFWEF